MKESLKKFLLDYLHETGAVDYFPGIGDDEIADTIPDACVARFEAALQSPTHEGRTQDHPQFFKPVVDHEIFLGDGGAAKITGRQLCWEVEVGVEGKRALVYLDAECRLQATFLDGTELTDKRALRLFVAGELDALVISLTRLQ